MTEQEWLDPFNPDCLLSYLRGPAGNRKRRLVAVAACRTIWFLTTQVQSRQAVEVAERFADGLAAEIERDQAEETARQAASTAYGLWENSDTEVAAAGAAYWAAAAASAAVSPGERDVEEAVSNAGMALAWSEDGNHAAGPDYWAGIELGEPWITLIREVFGNPFRPVTIAPGWLSWNDRAIAKMAQAIYDERAFDRLPLLADALEDAGCTEAEILTHCRGPGPHVRGCWVVDLLLEKK